MMRLKDLPTPAFVINRHAFEKNCSTMIEIAQARKLSLRPHVKTHKTRDGAWIQAAGKAWSDSSNVSDNVSGFVASTLPEVSMLVDAAAKYGKPFGDILYSIPISESKLRPLGVLRSKLPSDGRLSIIVDHPTQVAFVEAYVRSSSPGTTLPLPVFLKLDTGYHRAGTSCDDKGVTLALQILESPHLDLVGVYSHCGHAYDESSPEKQSQIAIDDISFIKSFLGLLKSRVASSEKLDQLVVSVGSTPSARHHENTVGLSNVEIHPGNYTLYDRQQMWIGSCTEMDVAGRVISRVIGHYEGRNVMLIDAGATALTKDTTDQGGVCEIGGHAELDCYRMSQEVILVRPKDAESKLPFDKFPLGSIVNLLPNHSCLAAACFEKYFVIDDDTCSFSPNQVVVDVWKPVKFFDISA